MKSVYSSNNVRVLSQAHQSESQVCLCILNMAWCLSNKYFIMGTLPVILKCEQHFGPPYGFESDFFFSLKPLNRDKCAEKWKNEKVQSHFQAVKGKYKHFCADPPLPPDIKTQLKYFAKNCGLWLELWQKIFLLCLLQLFCYRECCFYLFCTGSWANLQSELCLSLLK